MMTEIEGAAFAGTDAASARVGRAAVGIRYLLSFRQPPLTVRYILVSGVLGVPASILTLGATLYLYRTFVGQYNSFELNVMWVFNFELGLLRNFGLHCLYTWRMRPTWRRLYHAHVAAAGAFIIDIIVFNTVVSVSGVVPLAQLTGASSGFVFNFSYNKLKTFARLQQSGVKGGMPSRF
jgi:putative flippase GtrA